MGAPAAAPASNISPGYYHATVYHDDANPPPTLSNKITVAAFITLFIVLLLLCSVHLYGRWLWRSRRTSLSIWHELQSLHLQSHFGDVLHPAGLDKDVISTLPTFTHSPPAAPPIAATSADATENASLLECAICLSEFQEGEQGRLLPACNHSFHTHCIDMWFHSHSTCPLCRTPVVKPTPAVCTSTHDIEQHQLTEEQQQAAAYDIRIVIDTTPSTANPSSQFIDNTAVLCAATAAATVTTPHNPHPPHATQNQSSHLFPNNSSRLISSPRHSTSTHDASRKPSPPASSQKPTTRRVPRITIAIPTRQDIRSTSPAFLSLPSRRSMSQPVSPIHQPSSSHTPIKSPGIRASLNRIWSMQSGKRKSVVALAAHDVLDSSTDASGLPV